MVNSKSTPKSGGKDVFPEVFASIKSDIDASGGLFGSFLLLSLAVKFILHVSVSLYIPSIILFWFLLYRLYSFIVKKQKTVHDLYKFYTVVNFIDLLILTVAIHYVGGVEWIGAIFYLYLIATSGFLLPRKNTFFLVLEGGILYSLLVWGEYFQIIPHYTFFSLKMGLYREKGYVLVQNLTVLAFSAFLGYGITVFSERMRRERDALVKTREELVKSYEAVKEAKEVLEIKVRARTRQLAEQAEALEKENRLKTKSLREKLDELESFRRLTVGRELKMAQLKEEIANLKDKIKELEEAQSKN